MANNTAANAEREARNTKEPKLLLTLEDNVISAKEYSWVSGGLIGCTALMTDGSRRLFAENENPTELEFYGLDESIRPLALDEKKRRIFEATGFVERDELPWLEYDSEGNHVEGQDEAYLLDAWLSKP